MSTDSLIPPEGNEDPAFTHEKLDEIRASGREPYQLNYDRTHEAAGISSEFEALGPAEHTETQVRVAGRIMTLRAHGKLAFADLKDESGRIQLFAEAENLGERFAEFCDLDAGDWAGAWGTVMTTKRGELSVRLEGFELLSKCLRPLPEKWHGLKDVERRYRQRYLDLIANPKAVDVFNVRVKAVSAIRTWLQQRGFKEVETPILHPVAGGALAKPFSTYHEALNTTLFLRVAPELYLKRLVIGGIEKVFEINRSFRNEGVSVQHNPEFTMLELYQALADYHDMADLLQEMIRDVCTEVRGGVAIPFQGGTIEFGRPFRKVRMIDLVAEAGADPQTDLRADCDRLGVPFDPAWPWGKLLLEIYEKKVERSLMQPTFVMDYPIEVSPLARRHRSDPRFTEHLDLVIAGMEVGVAYSELTDPIDQRRRFEGQQAGRGAQDDESHAVDDDFLKALEYGMPPTGGLGFGIDRFMMILADEPSIREVILFPALRQEQSDGGPVPKAEA